MTAAGNYLAKMAIVSLDEKQRTEAKQVHCKLCSIDAPRKNNLLLVFEITFGYIGNYFKC